MSEHMLNTLRRLAYGATCGFHYGTLNALVGRGLARKLSHLDYEITDAGIAAIAKADPITLTPTDVAALEPTVPLVDTPEDQGVRE